MVELKENYRVACYLHHCFVQSQNIGLTQKQLAFTDVPIKDIANMVGFKTVQHFNRIFKEITGTTPAEFRKSSVQKRKEEL